MNIRNLRLALSIFAIAICAIETASAQHFDIFLARPATGTQTVIGGADVDAQAFDDTTRVFEAEMGALGGEFVALEPGVNHPSLDNPVTAYPPSAAGLLTTDVLRLFERDFSVAGQIDDLFYWDGIGAVSFTPAAADFRIDFADPLPGNPGAGGAYDDHPFLVVDSDAVEGLYLASVYGVIDGFDPTDPVFIVFATSEDFEDVHEVAVEWVQSNLVVPEPASLGLGAVACGSILALRRRKQ